MLRPALALMAVLALVDLNVLAQNQSPSLVVVDKTPKFLAFYHAATSEGAGEETRWNLWKKLYDFAAVPPGPDGDAMARRMLDAAWSKYPPALPQIRLGVKAIHPEPSLALKQVVALLDPSVAIKARVIVFVGAFEGNAYTFMSPDGPTVAVEVEDPDAGLKLTHEFTHVVEAEQSGLSLDWKRTLAQTIFAEGLAVHVVRQLHPELSDGQSIGEVTPGWFARAQEARAQIVADVLPVLSASDGDTTMRFTMGKGPAGIEREAYFAGWLVIGYLLDHGWTFPRLSRVQEGELVNLVHSTLLDLGKH